MVRNKYKGSTLDGATIIPLSPSAVSTDFCLIGQRIQTLTVTCSSEIQKDTVEPRWLEDLFTEANSNSLLSP